MVFASLGIGGVGFSALGAISKYANVFYGLTLGFLGVAHYLEAKKSNGSIWNKVILWTSTTAVIAMFLYAKRYYLTGLFT